MESIVLDDLPLQNTTLGTIIDLDDENSNDDVEILEVRQQTTEEQFFNIFKENKVLADLIEKCIELDDLGAMKRVMKRTLIPLYQSTTETFKKSLTFERALTKIVTNVQNDPTHKFSHVKEFCEFLKNKNEFFNRKKVDFVTLSTYVKAQSKSKHHKISRTSRKRRKVDAVIDLVNQEYEVPIINLNEQVCHLSSYTLHEVPVTFQTNDDNEKENAILNITLNNNEENKILEKQSIEPDKTANSTNVYLEPRTNYLPEYDCHTDEEKINERINLIESEIKSLKSIADRLDSESVTVDSYSSPYLQREYYHKKIVKLYKELCHLTGHEPVKRREVRLKAMDSRSVLPLKKLQALVNDNIKEDGLPHFPDFEEVVHCVQDANSEGDLRWDSRRVMHEARALFTYLGRALQRSRQRREWRDMLSIVKKELQDPADTDHELAAKLERNKILSREREYDVLDRFAALEQLPLVTNQQNRDIQIEQSDDSGEETTEEAELEITHVLTHKTQQRNAINTTSVLNSPNASVPNECPQINNISNPPNMETISRLDNSQGPCLSINTSKETIQFNVIREPLDTCISLTNLNHNIVPADKNETIINNNISTEGTNDSSHVNIPSESIVDNIMLPTSINESRNIDAANSEVIIDEEINNKDIQNILSDTNASTSRIEVLSIEIENSLDEVKQELNVEMDESNVEVDAGINENQKEISEINIAQADYNKSPGTDQIELEDVKVKVERTAEDVLRELNEMDDSSLTATIIDIIDPFLVIEISSDSDTDDEEDNNKIYEDSSSYLLNRSLAQDKS